LQSVAIEERRWELRLQCVATGERRVGCKVLQPEREGGRQHQWMCLKFKEKL
jgi:hypothetical protein